MSVSVSMRIKSLRERAGLSQRTVATALGISQSQLSLIEGGYVELATEQVSAIQEAIKGAICLDAVRKLSMIGAEGSAA